VKLGLLFAVGVVTLLTACGGSVVKPALRGTELSPAPRAPDFALRDQVGRTVMMSAQRGRWTVVTFLYTRCPDVCPLIAAHLNAALVSATGRRLGLRVLAVSVDPTHDTPAAVRRYVADHRLAPAFRWLIGSPAYLARVWRAYHVAALPGPHGTVTHSSVSFLIDPNLRERLLYDKTVTTADVLHDLRALALS
jgi:protein SCO1/2